MLLIEDEEAAILTKVFNVIINKSQFPKEWKTALTQPIYKGNGNRRKPGNYRGISLLAALGKIYSGITACWLRDWLLHNI
jgi:hypothetical protein